MSKQGKERKQRTCSSVTSWMRLYRVGSLSTSLCIPWTCTRQSAIVSSLDPAAPTSVQPPSGFTSQVCFTLRRSSSRSLFHKSLCSISDFSAFHRNSSRASSTAASISDWTSASGFTPEGAFGVHDESEFLLMHGVGRDCENIRQNSVPNLQRETWLTHLSPSHSHTQKSYQGTWKKVMYDRQIRTIDLHDLKSHDSTFTNFM